MSSGYIEKIEILVDKTEQVLDLIDDNEDEDLIEETFEEILDSVRQMQESLLQLERELHVDDIPQNLSDTTHNIDQLMIHGRNKLLNALEILESIGEGESEEERDDIDDCRSLLEESLGLFHEAEGQVDQFKSDITEAVANPGVVQASQEPEEEQDFDDFEDDDFDDFDEDQDESEDFDEDEFE